MPERIYLADLARARGVSEGTIRVYLHAARTGQRRQVRNPPPQPDGHEPAPGGGWRAWWDPDRLDVKAWLSTDPEDLGIKEEQ